MFVGEFILGYKGEYRLTFIIDCSNWLFATRDYLHGFKNGVCYIVAKLINVNMLLFIVF